MTRLGFKLKLNPNDLYVSAPIYCEGIYEPQVTELFGTIIDEGMVVVDVGANLGYYTVFASKLVNQTGRVYAFEPEEKNYQFLLRNIQLNDCQNVNPERRAVSDRIGNMKLYLSDSNPGDHTLGEQTSEGRRTVDTQTITLDEVFKNSSRVDIVKMDTQGHEMKCMRGMLQLIQSSPGLGIFMEFWPKGLIDNGSDPRDLLELIESLHFVIREILPDSIPLRKREYLLKKYRYEKGNFVNLYLSRRALAL
jgi:FkbM family methyltransferase